MTSSEESGFSPFFQFFRNNVFIESLIQRNTPTLFPNKKKSAANYIAVIQQFATKFWWYNFVKHWAVQNRGRMLAAYLNFDSFANSGYNLILLTRNIRAFLKNPFSYTLSL